MPGDFACPRSGICPGQGRWSTSRNRVGPQRPSVVLVDLPVPGYEWSLVQGRLADNQSIEWITRPVLHERVPGNLLERSIADLKTEITSKGLENIVDRVRESPDLDQVLQLDERHG